MMKSYSNNYVTFDDGARGKTKGIDKHVCLGFPYLDDVLLVEGLAANFISISQLSDQGLNVNFNKTESIFTSKDQEVLMKGSKSKYNSYLWVSQINVKP